MQLILASNSPRRRELLSECGRPFSVEPSRFEEKAAGLSARETALRFAEGKAREVFSRFPDAAVLGADTVVSLDGEIMGKPRDAAEAARFLRLLSGREHSVFTGVCLVGKGFFRSDAAETKVRFRVLSEETIKAYVKSGLPFDKAGAYGIQDGFDLAEGFSGSYTNVVGLPIELVRAFLEEMKL